MCHKDLAHVLRDNRPEDREGRAYCGQVDLHRREYDRRRSVPCRIKRGMCRRLRLHDVLQPPDGEHVDAAAVSRVHSLTVCDSDGDPGDSWSDRQTYMPPSINNPNRPQYDFFCKPGLKKRGTATTNITASNIMFTAAWLSYIPTNGPTCPEP